MKLNKSYNQKKEAPRMCQQKFLFCLSPRLLCTCSAQRLTCDEGVGPIGVVLDQGEESLPGSEGAEEEGVQNLSGGGEGR